MKTPVSTYRIQFTPDFTFKNASEIVDYLHEIGIDTLYASPVFHARPGSNHGYDVIDPTSYNPQLGTTFDFDELFDKIEENQMGWMQDIVPNHMAYHYDNKWMRNVLENGRYSPYVQYFDVNWENTQDNFKNKILAPFLGKPYGLALEDKEIQLEYNEGGNIVAAYWENIFPVKIESYPEIIPGIEKIYLHENEDKNVKNEIEQLTGIKNKALRDKKITELKQAIYNIYQTEQSFKQALDDNIKKLNGTKGDKSSFNKLDYILRDQHYRLCFWQVANTSNNYRRFFTINDLISVRADLQDVFNDSHELIIENCLKGKFTALRIDHVDGLYNPANYLSRLKKATKNTFTLVEKILEFDEKLPTSWNMEGSTGYDYMNFLNLVFCNNNSKAIFDCLYTEINETGTDEKTLLYNSKKEILLNEFYSRLENISRSLAIYIWQTRYGVDATIHAIKEVLIAYLCALPVYRTYHSSKDLPEQDEAFILQALNEGKEKLPEHAHLFEVMGNILLMKIENGGRTKKAREDWLMINRQIEQLSGPLMAKGLEDTLLYRYIPLLSVNEVGGNPFRFGITNQQFIGYLKERQENFPYSMNASSTHDTKRGEDTRARLNVLSSIPDEWFALIELWMRENEKFKENEWPDKNIEYALYQTIIGIYPTNGELTNEWKDRIKNYLVKFARESKTYTSWTSRDEEYENILVKFIDKVLSKGNKKFIGEITDFSRKIMHHGVYNSLSQVTIKICSPGIPDFYQGTELWDLTLVDPDNRKPVDYSLRQELRQEIVHNINDPGYAYELFKNADNDVDGKIKMFVTIKLLHFRNRKKELLLNGKVKEVNLQGKNMKNVLAFSRILNDEELLIIVPKYPNLLVGLDGLLFSSDFQDDTKLIMTEGKENGWSEILTGREIEPKDKKISLEELLKPFPVAVLYRKGM